MSAEGTVYPALTRLESKGLLTSRLVASDTGPARKYYRPTDAGAVELDRAATAWVAGWITLAVVVAAFFILTLYYTEGVLDAGVAEPVSSSLFPFFGSDLTVDPSGGGIAWSVAPGPMPFVSAFAAWLLVAKPWRCVLTRSSSLES